MVQMDGKKADILREATGVKIGLPVSVTDSMVAVEAVLTSIAGNVVAANNPVASAVLGNAVANFHHLARHFVAQNERSAMYPVPLHHIAATYAAGLDPYQHLARAYDRSRPLL
jgi:hypothetical protein